MIMYIASRHLIGLCQSLVSMHGDFKNLDNHLYDLMKYNYKVLFDNSTEKPCPCL